MTPTAASARPTPVLHQVKIQLHGNKLMYVDTVTGKNAENIFVRKGDLVTWHFEQGNLAILFKGKSPFAEVGFATGPDMMTMRAPAIGAPGEYHYAVLAIPAGGRAVLEDPVLTMGDGD